jgi:tight adherence protein B
VWAAGPAVAAGAAGLVAAGPGGAAAALLVAVVVRRRRVSARERRAAGATADELAGALRRMTDELRAGGHPVTALAGCAADGPLATRLLAPAAAAAGLGESVAAALRSAGDSAGAARADLDRIATAWALAERHGVPLADLIADAHDAIRWRRRFAAEVAAQLAGPRATATVLSALPALGLALGQLVGADPLGVLRGGLLGQALLVTGVGLAVAGSAWSDRILAGAVPR